MENFGKRPKALAAQIGTGARQCRTPTLTQSLCVDTFGTGKVDDEKLVAAVRKNFSLTPKGIIESLDLRRPIYRKTAAYGHFGRTEKEFTWEATNKAAALREACGLKAEALATK